VTVTGDPTVIAAGDIGDCSMKGVNQTAALLATLDGTILALGDNAYDSGSTQEYAACYDPTWGRFKARTRPVPGNHEYITPGAAPYFAYFGPSVGEPGKGWYSYDLGAWHLIALNSNCQNDQPIACGAGSEEANWLKDDLRRNQARCTVAYMHHPRYSSGQQGNTDWIKPLWQVLYDGRVDVVLNGHDHLYERFAPQDNAATADPRRGIRQFTVGTGGGVLYTFDQIRPNSEVHQNDTWGVLKLTLHPSGYDWQFVPVAGKTFTDSGSGACH
jgi:hypothetical protein